MSILFEKYRFKKNTFYLRKINPTTYSYMYIYIYVAYTCLLLQDVYTLFARVVNGFFSQYFWTGVYLGNPLHFFPYFYLTNRIYIGIPIF